MDLDILNKTLEPDENPGLETTDPRLGEIGSFIQNAKYGDAAEMAQSVFEEDVFDVRILGYFMYGIFDDQGLIALEGINTALIKLLQENWDAFGPSKKKEKHAQISLNWFIKQVVKTLSYEEQKKGARWQKWLAEVSSDNVEQILESLDLLIKELFNVLEDNAGNLQEGLMNIKNQLKSFQRLVYVEPEEEPEDEYEPEDEGSFEDSENEEELKDENETRPFTHTPVAPASDSPGIAGSWHLKELIKKIEAFEFLAGQGKFEMASLVADDVNEIISNFDPKVYFPELFSGFSMTYVKSINELIACDVYKGSANWLALQELYKVDLDSFISFDPGGLPESQYNNQMSEEAGGGLNDGYDTVQEENYEEEDDDDEW